MSTMLPDSRLVRRADLEAGTGPAHPERNPSSWIAAARRWMSRNVWLCPVLMIVLAATAFVLFGASPWRALLIAMLLACPVLIVWGAITVRRSNPENQPKIVNASHQTTRRDPHHGAGGKGTDNG
jgi:hypothetical protein